MCCLGYLLLGTIHGLTVLQRTCGTGLCHSWRFASLLINTAPPQPGLVVPVSRAFPLGCPLCATPQSPRRQPRCSEAPVWAGLSVDTADAGREQPLGSRPSAGLVPCGLCSVSPLRSSKLNLFLCPFLEIKKLRGRDRMACLLDDSSSPKPKCVCVQGSCSRASPCLTILGSTVCLHSCFLSALFNIIYLLILKINPFASGEVAVAVGILNEVHCQICCKRSGSRIN